MNTKRVTVSIPNYIYSQLITKIPPRLVSQFVASAVEEKIINIKTITNKKDPVGEFLMLRRTLPVNKSRKQIINAINEGRI